MKTVLVTGDNGFIGGYLCRFYNNIGDTVIGISDQEVADQSYTHYTYNLLQEAVDEVLEKHKPDVILHCAGSANVALSIQNPNLDFKLNVGILYSLLNAMKRTDCKAKLIFFSSASVYGQPEILPIKENYPVNPISPYAMHKVICEQICEYFNRNHGFHIQIIRIFSAYGPELKKQLFWDMSQKVKETGELSLFGTGDESRDFIYIDDLIHAVDCIVNYSGSEKVFNLANGEEKTVRFVANCFLREWGNPSVTEVKFSSVKRTGDPNNWRADISLLQKTGYIQKVSMEEGIRQYVDWVKNVREKI